CAANTVPVTSVSCDIETTCVVEKLKVAVSSGPFGKSPCFQLAAVFQSADMGDSSHSALIAYVTVGMRNIREQRIAARMSVFTVTSGVWHRRSGACIGSVLSTPGSYFLATA